MSYVFRDVHVMQCYYTVCTIIHCHCPVPIQPPCYSFLVLNNYNYKACDVTVPDTYAESHIGDTATEESASANQAAVNKISEYDKLASTHIIYSVAIETGGTLAAWLSG